MPDAACGRFPAGCDRGSICLTLLISAYDAAVGKPPVCALMRRARTGGFCILAAIPSRQRFVHLAARAAETVSTFLFPDLRIWSSQPSGLGSVTSSLIVTAGIAAATMHKPKATDVTE
ncbi:hypothetical protein MCC01954_11260 [Bifidobacteriaceae bacterium MCC01954]|nr:hypothetical protein MCC01954_11260 [Bifidobacteriaceae bacterium MCC01954]